MTDVGFESLVAWWGEKILTRDDLAYLDPLIGPEIDPGLFPARVHRLTPGETVEAIGVRIARAAVEAAGIGADEVDCLIVDNRGGRHVLPGIATFVHRELGLREEIPVYDVRLGGATFLEMCRLAELHVRGGLRCALVVTVTAPSDGQLDRSSLWNLIISDGAAAAVVSAEKLLASFVAVRTRTDGSIYDHFTQSARLPQHPELLAEAERVVGVFHDHSERFWGRPPSDGNRAVAEGRAHVRPLLLRTLGDAGLELSDVRWVIAHQATPHWLEREQADLELAGYPRDHWFDTYDEYGNGGTVDVPANLVELVRRGNVRRGDLVCLFARGGGGRTACLLVRWLDDEGHHR